jgi:hypothetical protein
VRGAAASTATLSLIHLLRSRDQRGRPGGAAPIITVV